MSRVSWYWIFKRGMFAVENQLPSCARFRRWCTHCPSTRKAAVGFQVIPRKVLTPRDSAASEKITPLPAPTFALKVNARFGVLNPILPPQRLHRPGGTEHGTRLPPELT